MVLVREPGGAVRVEVPADRVGTVLGKLLHRVGGVALRLRHLLPVLIEDVTENDDVLVGRLIEDEGRDRHQRIEPAAGLVDGLADEVSGEVLLKDILVLKGVVPLGKGHRARVKPAVDDLGGAAHLLAALRAGNDHLVNEGAVKLDVFGAVLGDRAQLLARADRMQVTAFAGPDVEGRAPVAVTRKTPVLHVLQPVAETTLADVLGDPVDRLIVADQILAHLAHLDEPGVLRVVNEGGVAAPAEGVLMLELGRREEQTARIEIGEDHGVGVFDELAGGGSGLLHVTLGVHHLDEGQIVAATDARVVITEGGGDMNDTGTVRHRHVAVREDVVRALALRLGDVIGAGVEGLVALADEGFTDHLLKDLVGRGAVLRKRAEDGIKQGLGHIVGIAVGRLHAAVGVGGADAERGVRGQGPGRRRPGEEVGILVECAEANDRRALLDRLIALGYLVRGEGRAAARAVGHALEALVEQAAVKDLTERPPLRLDVIVVIGDVGIVHIGPEADDAGELLPHPLILPHALLAFVNEGGDAVLLDLLLAVKAELFLDLKLHGQTVGVPARLTQDVGALHRAVARDHILDDARQHVADVRLAVRGRRTVVEGVVFAFFSAVDALLEDVVLLPEGKHLALTVNEVHVRRYLVVHGRPP